MIEVVNNTETSSTTSSKNNSKEDTVEKTNHNFVAMNGISAHQQQQVEKGQLVREQDGGSIDTATVLESQVEKINNNDNPEHDVAASLLTTTTSTANINMTTNHSANTTMEDDDDVAAELPPPSGMVSLTSDDYPSRPSRESVLQRLSEALLRRSLTQVSF